MDYIKINEITLDVTNILGDVNFCGLKKCTWLLKMDQTLSSDGKGRART
jgi:hypothetical protein